ncbi:MAG TPA: hypothetical protein VH277_16690 [Gemmatimonadaceae bacterium]|nr:hypothetical protein [Gemmatimonadaceae bacterium]
MMPRSLVTSMVPRCGASHLRSEVSILASAALSLLALVPAAGAQSVDEIGARIAPQYHSYDIQSPSNLKISEFSVPLFVLVPVSPVLSFDIGTSYARADVRQTAAGQVTRSSVSGLTDTQIRGNYTLGNDFVVLTAGVNLPTGKSTVTEQQRLAAGLIGSDFLSFPISNMGTGFGGTAGAAVARPLGDWNFGFGASMRRAASYDPFNAAGVATLHYQPGNEYRVRGGIDRAVGTGRLALGLTYSTFGNDNLAGSIYNTGNRWLTQFGYDNSIGVGELTLGGWNLFRTAGTLADSSYLPHEDIGNVALAYGIPLRVMILEPNVEGRTWFQGGGVPTSFMGTFGLRSQVTMLGLTMVPSVQYSLGRIAAQDQAGADLTAAMSGWHGELAIRLR